MPQMPKHKATRYGQYPSRGRPRGQKTTLGRTMALCDRCHKGHYPTDGATTCIKCLTKRTGCEVVIIWDIDHPGLNRSAEYEARWNKPRGFFAKQPAELVYVRPSSLDE